MTTLPRQCLVAPPVEHHALSNPANALGEALDHTWASEPWKGRRVAIAIGSRGVDRIGEMAATLVGWLRARGAEPVIVPAMGSHGGATAEGQREVLAGYGVTEREVGAPIDASMEVTEVGESALGVKVVIGAAFLAADAVIVVNRVKPHTDFDSVRVGSGLLKMSVIGLGKAEGAFRAHWAAKTQGYEQVFLDVSAAVLSHLPNAYGIALVEDGSHKLGHITLLKGAEFHAREPELLKRARSWMPALPIPEVDVLIVDEIGKNISGAGMDTNIVGRGVDTRPMANRNVEVRAIYARGLTPESRGNAVGIGLADIVSTRLVEEMDPVSSYTNAISALTPATVRISINFRTDAECLRAALRVAAADVNAPRIVRIRHTLALDRVVVSEACVPTLKAGVETLVAPTEWALDAKGNFDARTDLLAEVAAH
jgi:Lactate racemase N-terminal domain